MFKPLSQWYKDHHPCHLCSPYLQRLRISPDFCQQLVSNLYVGVLITILLLFSPLHQIPLLTTIEDTAIDWVINLHLHTELKQPQTPPFVFINLDEPTYQKWGAPLITPRDKLRQLIAFALAGQPKAIVVDIDLSYPTHCITERTQCLTDTTKLDAADVELRDFLANYGQSNCNGKPCPYLILVKPTQPVLDAQGESTGQRQLRPSFLDAVVQQNPLIYWASSLFALEDNQLRRWHLCEPGKTAKLDVLPSVQLLITELLNTAETTPVKQRIQEKCEAAETGKEELSQRILYALLPTNEKVPYPLVVVPDDQIQRPLLDILPAYLLIENPKANKEALRHSIVVIGNSYFDSNDLYTTPVGSMSGALVIVNAIHSLQQHGTFQKNKWVALLMEVLSIIVMSIAFARFNSFYGMLASGLFVMVVMVPLSFWLFKYGWWLDFAIPLVAVQLHRMAAVFHRSHP